MQGHIVPGVRSEDQSRGGGREGDLRAGGGHTIGYHLRHPAHVPGTRGSHRLVQCVAWALESPIGSAGIGDIRAVGVAARPGHSAGPRPRGRGSGTVDT